MADLYQEIKEDLKQERVLHLWQRFRWHVIGSVLGILFGTASITFYQDYTANKNKQFGGDFYRITEGAETSSERWSSIENVEHVSIQALAKLRKAASLLNNDNKEGAQRLYQEVSSGKDVPQEFRDLAHLILFYMEEGSSDLASTGAWKRSAQELQVMRLLKEGKQEQASQELASLLSDEQLPYGIRQRAQQVKEAVVDTNTSLTLNNSGE